MKLTLKKWGVAMTLGVMLFGGCRSVDDDRIPPVPVYINFTTAADWITYGVGGAGQWRRFIKAEREPGNYPYTALTQTGFGGVLLVSDFLGAPHAYDLACPVECKATIRVSVDPDIMKAVCPVCHSVYEVFENYGYPVGGPAADKGYGLTRYYVGPGPQGESMVITR